MRIIAGTAKGKKLFLPKKSSVRPTLDKVKGAVFNILGDRIIDAKVLDLFCGSGGLGIEALSRGSENCMFVDVDVSFVRKNLSNIGFDARVVKGDARKVIGRLSKEKAKFDVVFADPPYDKGFIRNILKLLNDSDIVSNSGLIVFEHSRNEQIDGVKRLERKYGDTIISVL